MKSISNQILVYILFSLSVVFGGLYFYRVGSRTQLETDRFEKNSVRTCERLALFYASPIQSHDVNLINEHIDIEALDENIRSIQILDKNNQLFAGVVRKKNKVSPITSNQLLILHQDSIVKPISYQGKVIGKVILYPNKESLEQFVGKFKRLFLLELFVFSLSVALILIFILKKVVITPLSSLKAWVSSINADTSIQEPKLFRSTEIDTIIGSVSQLTERLISTLKESSTKSNLISEKESLITSISTNLSEGMIYRLVTNDNGDRKFTYLSGSFQKLYGHTPEEGMADPRLIFGSVLEEDIQSLLDAEAQSKRNLSTYRCEVRMANPDGTIRVSRFVSTPKVLVDGSISWDGLELDITDLKKTQEDLKKNQFLMQSITDGLPDSIFAKDLNGNFTFVNSAITKRFNKSASELLGNDIRTVFSPEASNARMAMDVEIIKDGKTRTFEESDTADSGGVVYLATKGAIKDEKGNSVGLFGIDRDITALKNTQDELEQFKSLLKSITDGLPDNIFAKDLDGRYLFTNWALAKRANKSPEELLGKNSRDVFLQADADRTLEKDFEIMKSGETETFEEELTTVTGSVAFLTTKGPIKDLDGKTIGLFGIARDITERKKAEEALRVSQEKFEFAFNSSPNAVLIQDVVTGKYTEVNVSNEKIFGYAPEEVIGKSSAELNLYKDPNVREKMIEMFNEQGYVRNVEVVGRHASGSDLHLLLTVQRNYIDNHPFMYIDLQDVTERKLVELELQKLNLDKDRFMSILGHDLRGPVNGIVSLIDIVNDNMGDMKMDEIKEIMSLIYQSAKNTSKLMDDVLLWSTAQSGKMKFNPELINFKEKSLGVIELLQSVANAKNIEIELSCENSLEVYADRNMLGTVLRNLLSNALKFTRREGKITLLAEKTTESIVVSITDNGVGISAQDIDKIFDKAQLFSSIGTNEEKGTGFGLKLCQEFIGKHGGKIWVESEVGKGTVFCFSLPNAV